MHFVGGGIQTSHSRVTHSAVAVPAGTSILQPGALVSLGGCPLVVLILSEVSQMRVCWGSFSELGNGPSIVHSPEGCKPRSIVQHPVRASLQYQSAQQEGRRCKLRLPFSLPHCISFCFCSSRVRTLGLTEARQAHYH